METQVKTMQNENSGISPKLRTYGQIRSVTLQNMVIRNGGGTIDLADPTMGPAQHKTGYYVGGLAPAHTFARVGSDVRNYQRGLGLAYAATQGLGLVGAWEDGGVVYIEASEWMEDKDLAIYTGRVRGELAIFDIAAGKDIRL